MANRNYFCYRPSTLWDVILLLRNIAKWNIVTRESDQIRRDEIFLMLYWGIWSNIERWNIVRRLSGTSSVLDNMPPVTGKMSLFRAGAIAYSSFGKVAPVEGPPTGVTALGACLEKQSLAGAPPQGTRCAPTLTYSRWELQIFVKKYFLDRSCWGPEFWVGVRLSGVPLPWATSPDEPR